MAKDKHIPEKQQRKMVRAVKQGLKGVGANVEENMNLKGRIKMEKPNWWPKNPYPEDIFPMDRSEYLKIVPDPHIRTALSGCLGRMFWKIASDSIYERYKEYVLENKS